MNKDFNVEDLIKYSVIAVALQVALAIILVLSGGTTGLELVLTAYYPIITIVSYAGGFTGESTMMLPVFAGVILGGALYGLLVGFVITRLKRFSA